MSKFDKKRQDANLELIHILKHYLEHYPSMRFSQALYNLNLVNRKCETDEKGSIKHAYWLDEHHVEPWDLLARVNQLLYLPIVLTGSEALSAIKQGTHWWYSEDHWVYYDLDKETYRWSGLGHFDVSKSDTEDWIQKQEWTRKHIIDRD